jgi:hypothetical protein
MFFLAFAIGAGLLLIADFGGTLLGVDSRDGWNVDPRSIVDFDAVRRPR